MENNYSVVTKKAVEEIVNFVNKPTFYRRLTFFFGAGINFNISSNALDGNNLSNNAIGNFLKKNKNRYTKFEMSSMTDGVKKIINNNKMLLSLDESLEIKINQLPSNEIEGFREGYIQLMKSMNNKISIYTTNYDLLLDNVFHRKPVNFLDEDINDEFREVIHMHGMVDNKNRIIKPSLLSLENYVDYSEIVENKFYKQLAEKVKQKNKYEETILIIGSSLQEEHIIRPLRKFKNNSGKTNILLIAHFPSDKFFMKKIDEIYNQLGIRVVNINSGKSYKNDFKLFWKLLSKEIKSGVIYSPFSEFSDDDNIIDNELYSRIRKKLSNNEKLSLEDFLKKIKGSKKYSNALIRPIYWLENNDKILLKGSLKKYFFKYIKNLPISDLHFLEYKYLNNNEILLILDEFEKKIETFKDFGYDNNKFSIISFLNKNFHRINPNDFKVRKNLNNFLIKEAFSLSYRIESEFLEFIKNDLEINFKEKIIYTNEYPKRNTYYYKQLERVYNEGESPLGIEIPKKMDDFITIIKNLKEDKIDRISFYTIFQIPKYKKFLEINMNNIITLLDKNNATFSNYGHKNYEYIIHVLLYVSFINDQQNKDKYLKAIKQINAFFEDFPRAIDIKRTSFNDDEVFSVYDGKPINKRNLVIKSGGELDKILKQQFINRNTKNSIIYFIKDNLSKDSLKKILSREKIFSLFAFEKANIFEGKCNNGIEYCELIKIYNENDKHEKFYHLIRINPPHDIYKRIADLVKSLSLEKSYDSEELDEIIQIINVKIKLGSYTKKNLIWWNEEINLLIRKYSNVPKVIEIINKLFLKYFKGDKNHFKKIMYKDFHIKNYLEFEFSAGFNKKHKSIKTEYLIGMFNNEEMEMTETFYRLAGRNIQQNDNKENWYSEFLLLIRFIKSKKNENSNAEHGIKKFKEIICGNFIVDKIDTTFSKLDIPLKLLTNVISYIEEPKIYDERILNALNESKDINYNIEDFAGILRLIEKNDLGEKTINGYKEKLLTILRSSKTEFYFYGIDDVYQFIEKHFDEVQKKEAIKLLNKIDKKWKLRIKN